MVLAWFVIRALVLSCSIVRRGALHLTLWSLLRDPSPRRLNLLFGVLGSGPFLLRNRLRDVLVLAAAYLLCDPGVGPGYGICLIQRFDQLFSRRCSTHLLSCALDQAPSPYQPHGRAGHQVPLFVSLGLRGQNPCWPQELSMSVAWLPTGLSTHLRSPEKHQFSWHKIQDASPA